MLKRKLFPQQVCVPGPAGAQAQRALVAANNEFLGGASKYNKPNEPTIMFLTFQT